MSRISLYLITTILLTKPTCNITFCLHCWKYFFQPWTIVVPSGTRTKRTKNTRLKWCNGEPHDLFQTRIIAVLFCRKILTVLRSGRLINVAKCHSMRVTQHSSHKHILYDYTLHQQTLENVQSAQNILA